MLYFWLLIACLHTLCKGFIAQPIIKTMKGHLSIFLLIIGSHTQVCIRIYPRDSDSVCLQQDSEHFEFSGDSNAGGPSNCTQKNITWPVVLESQGKDWCPEELFLIHVPGCFSSHTHTHTHTHTKGILERQRAEHVFLERTARVSCDSPLTLLCSKIVV